MNPTIGRRDAHRLPRSARVNQTVTRPPHSRHVRQRGNGPRTSGRREQAATRGRPPSCPPNGKGAKTRRPRRPSGGERSEAGRSAGCPGSERDSSAASAPAHQEGVRKRSWPTQVQRVFSRQRAIGAEGLSGRGRLTSLAPRPRCEGGGAYPPPSQRRDVERNRGGKAGGCAESSVVEGLAFSGQFRCALRSMTGAWHRKWPISP